MPKPKPDSSQARVVKRMRSQGATIGAIARRLQVPHEDARRLVWGSNYRKKVQVFRNGKLIPLADNNQIPHQPTPETFVKWLKNEAIPRLKELNEWPMGVEKYSYFTSEAVWGVRVLATVEEPSSHLAKLHRNGDEEAIFRIGKSNRRALAIKWVLRQLIEWRLANSANSKRQFEKFMRAYWGQQGHRTIKTMVESIVVDQAIYSDSLTWPKGSRVSGLADKHNVSKDRVKGVLKYYKKGYLQWKQSPRARLWLSISPAQ